MSPIYEEASLSDDNLSSMELYEAIPAHCFRRSNLRAFSFVIRDLLISAVLVYLASFISGFSNGLLRFAFWSIYGFAQGTIFTGIWVLGHECGHGAFFRQHGLNDLVGYILHSFLMTPYFSWKHVHTRHHVYTSQTDGRVIYIPSARDEIIESALIATSDDSTIYRLVQETPLVTVYYLLIQQVAIWVFGFYKLRGYSSYFSRMRERFKSISSKKDLLSSDFALAAAWTIAYCCARKLGWSSVLLYYGIPYLWLNHWLILIVYLQHSDPALPKLNNGTWSFHGNKMATIDRDFGFIERHVFHNIIETHVLHHLCSEIPFYNAEEATYAARKILGKRYVRDNTNLFASLWKSARPVLKKSAV